MLVKCPPDRLTPKHSIATVCLLAAAALLGLQANAQVMQRRIDPPNPSATTIAFLPPDSPIAMEQNWERMPGCARHISIASLDNIWAAHCGADRRRDAGVIHWRKGGWDSPGYAGADRVAAFYDMRFAPKTFGGYSGVITIDSSYNARMYATSGDPAGQSRNWQADGRVQDVASGGQWIWGVRPPEGDNRGGAVVRSTLLPFYAGKNRVNRWSTYGSVRAVRIGVGLTDGIAWIIGEDGSIHRRLNQGEGWEDKPGCGTAIANAGADNVWLIGCETPDSSGNRGIHHWNGDAWVRVPGQAVEIAVQSDGKAWVLTADGGVWRRKGS